MGTQGTTITQSTSRLSAERGVQIRGLVIEDNDKLRSALCDVLSSVGIDAYGVDRAHGVDELLTRGVMDLEVKDVASNAGAYTDLLPRLRMAPGAGVVLFMTDAAERREGAASLQSDAVKTLNVQALEFILQNLYRSLGGSPSGRPAPEDDSWTYDAERWTLNAPNGGAVQLTLPEAQIVRCLIVQRGQVTSREDLLNALNRPHLEAYSRNLDVTVSRLRKKVESLCRLKLPIISARGRGYVFSAPAAIVG